MADELYGEKRLIDTVVEHERLEYRPKAKYVKKVTYKVDFPVEATTQEPSIDEESGEYSPSQKPTQQYMAFVEHSEALRDLIVLAEEEIKDMEIKLSEGQVRRLLELSPIEMSGKLLDHTVNFDLYKETFTDPENPGYMALQDMVTAYAEDVDGNLELEVYEDLIELKLGLEEGFYLYKESILKNYVDGDIPLAATADEDFAKKIEEAVVEQNDWFRNVEKEYQSKEKSYYESLRTEYGSPEFFSQSKKYLDKKRPYDIAVREEKTLTEMGYLVDGLLVGTDECVTAIKSRLVLGSDIEPEEVMKVLENQAASTEQLSELMKLTQLSLKLQVNQQIQEKKQYRDLLKNINNLPRKKRAHDELLMAYELRNKMYLSMYDTLQHLESPSKKRGVETFLNNVAGGLNLVQEEYEGFLKDIYLMYASEYEVRREKIGKTLEKDNARAGYSLVLDYL